jgi:hypothetical protein
MDQPWVDHQGDISTLKPSTIHNHTNKQTFQIESKLHEETTGLGTESYRCIGSITERSGDRFSIICQ